MHIYIVTKNKSHFIRCSIMNEVKSQKYETAINYCLKAVECYDSLESYEDSGAILCDLAKIQLKADKYDDATKAYVDASDRYIKTKKFDKAGDCFVKARDYLKAAEIYLKYAKSEEETKGEGVFRSIGDWFKKGG